MAVFGKRRLASRRMRTYYCVFKLHIRYRLLRSASAGRRGILTEGLQFNFYADAIQLPKM